MCDQVPLEGARAPGQGPEEQQGYQGQEQELWEQEQEVQQAKVEDVGQDPENGFTRPFPTKKHKLTVPHRNQNRADSSRKSAAETLQRKARTSHVS